MSLAFKLWKIGSVIKKDEIKQIICNNSKIEEEIKNEGKEPVYVNINFDIQQEQVVSVDIKENAISSNRMFFTKKLGGTSNSYYMYPNINPTLKLVKKEKDQITLFEKLKLLKNTLIYSVSNFSNEENQKFSSLIINYIEDDKNSTSLEPLKNFKEGYFIFWISINNKTVFELMPEVYDNWFKEPVTKNKEAKTGFDIFTNKEATIGYRPEFKAFSYDQYHPSHNYRIIENLPLSLESARNIKFAWIYILNNLVFFYQGLEYIILPNMITFDKNAFKTIINRLRRANANTSEKRERQKNLKNLRKQETKLQKDLEKLEKTKHLSEEQKEKQYELNEDYITLKNNITKDDTGYISEFNNQAEQLGDLKNSVTLDFIFVSVDRTNLSFEIKGSIEDVIPSRLSEIVNLMQDKNNRIEDNITLTSFQKEKTYLQDYFNRDELYFIMTSSKGKNINSVIQERLFLAKLLLTDETISICDLLKRFEVHRELDYKRQKKIKNGIKEWINYSASFTKHEERIITFLNNLNKIRE